MSRSMLLVACALAYLGATTSALYVDRCGANEFERLYARANLMTMDYRNPETHLDVTRYKRDFADASKFEQNTFITWRFPNGETNNQVYLVLNQMRDSLLIPNQNLVTYAFSSDDRTWTNVETSRVQSTITQLAGGDGSWSRNDIRITLPTQARYFRMTWYPCEWNAVTQRATCRDYYSPSVNLFCAASTARGEVASEATCTGGDPVAVDPTPNYCGARVVNNWWDFRRVGSSINALGAYSSGDGSMTRTQHHVTKYGIGQGEIAMNLTAGSSYWVESLVTGTACFDASRYTHLLLEITARDGFSADVVLEQGTAGSCNVRPAERRVATTNTARYATFTSLEKKVLSIPLSDFGPAGSVNLANLRTIVLNNFVNPSRNWVYMSTIAFVGAPYTLPVLATPVQSTLTAGGTARTHTFGCVASAAFNNPALKFRAQASAAGARFSIRISTSSVDTCRTQSTVTVVSNEVYTFPADDLHLPYEFSVPMTQRRIVSVQFLGLNAGSVTFTNVRIGTRDCLEPTDAIRPDYAPKPYPAGQSQAPYDIFPPANI